MLTRRTVISAIRESTYGTDPAMTGSNALYAYDVDLDIKGEVLDRDILRDTLSNIGHVVGMKECALKFKVEMKGVGLTGTVPTESEMCLLLSGCGFNTGVNTGTTRLQSLVSDEASINSLAFKVFKDGNIHKIVGARGTAKINLEAGKYGYLDLEYKGLYDAVTAGTVLDHAGAPTGIPPIVYNSSFQVAGYAAIASKAEIDIANDITRRESLNATYGVQSFRLTKRKPTLSFDADAVIEATHAFWGKWAAATVGTWSIAIGSVAGSYIKMSGYYAPQENKYGDADGVSKYDVKAALVSSDVNSSNDEIQIVYI
jgi:hypothetical protein